MKTKALKIQEHTLFVYKKENQQMNGFPTTDTTDTTTMGTTTTTTTGIFNQEKNRR